MSSYGGSFTAGSVLPYDGSIIVSSAAQAVRQLCAHDEADGIGETRYCSCFELPTWCPRFRVSYELQGGELS